MLTLHIGDVFCECGIHCLTARMWWRAVDAATPEVSWPLHYRPRGVP